MIPSLMDEGQHFWRHMEITRTFGPVAFISMKHKEEHQPWVVHHECKCQHRERTDNS